MLGIYTVETADQDSKIAYHLILSMLCYHMNFVLHLPTLALSFFNLAATGTNVCYARQPYDIV